MDYTDKDTIRDILRSKEKELATLTNVSKMVLSIEYETLVNILITSPLDRLCKSLVESKSNEEFDSYIESIRDIVKIKRVITNPPLYIDSLKDEIKFLQEKLQYN